MGHDQTKNVPGYPGYPGAGYHGLDGPVGEQGKLTVGIPSSNCSPQWRSIKVLVALASASTSHGSTAIPSFWYSGRVPKHPDFPVTVPGHVITETVRQCHQRSSLGP
eukprot:670593-Rhodomonas_salina.1